MREQLQGILERTQGELGRVQDSAALDALRVRVLGKKGELTAILRGMGQLSPEERPAVGQLVNQVRAQIEGGIERRLAELKAAERARQLASEDIDVKIGRASCRERV